MRLPAWSASLGAPSSVMINSLLTCSKNAHRLFQLRTRLQSFYLRFKFFNAIK